MSVTYKILCQTINLYASLYFSLLTNIYSLILGSIIKIRVFWSEAKNKFRSQNQMYGPNKVHQTEIHRLLNRVRRNLLES